MDTKKHKKDVEMTTRYLKELAVYGVTTVAMDMALNDYKANDLREKLVRQSFEMELSERVVEMKSQAVTLALTVEESELDIPITFEPEFISKDWPSQIDKEKMVTVPAYILQEWQLERSHLYLQPVTTFRELFRILVHSIRERVKSWHMMWQYWR